MGTLGIDFITKRQVHMYYNWLIYTNTNISNKRTHQLLVLKSEKEMHFGKENQYICIVILVIAKVKVHAIVTKTSSSGYRIENPCINDK